MLGVFGSVVSQSQAWVRTYEYAQHISTLPRKWVGSRDLGGHHKKRALWDGRRNRSAVQSRDGGLTVTDVPGIQYFIAISTAGIADRRILIFPVQKTTSRIGNLTRLIHILAICLTIHCNSVALDMYIYVIITRVFKETPERI